LASKAKVSGLTKPDGSAYTQAEIENAMRNSGKGSESITKGMQVDPNKPNAITDKGAVWTSNDGKTLVQVNQDGRNLNPSTIDSKLAAYIVQETGGANTPYKDLYKQVEAAKAGPATNLNAHLNTMTPAANGCVTAECSANVGPVTKPNDAAAALGIGVVLTGVGAVTGNPALIGSGVNLTAQGAKAAMDNKNQVSLTEAAISGATGSLGAVAAEVQVIKTVIQQGGSAATATSAGIGAVTNVVSDTATKVVKGEDVTLTGTVGNLATGAIGATLLPKNPIVPVAATEVLNAVKDKFSQGESK
jgi:hypothetical protein